MHFLLSLFTHRLKEEEPKSIEVDRVSRYKETLSLKDYIKWSPLLNFYGVKPLTFWDHFLKLAYPFKY